MKKSNGPGFSHSRIFRENEKKHKTEKNPINWVPTIPEYLGKMKKNIKPRNREPQPFFMQFRENHCMHAHVVWRI